MKFIDWFAEEWMTIEGYGGAYQVSNHGNVKSVERTVIRSNGRPYHITERMMKPVIDNKGYVRVHLNDNGKTKFVPVHRLVAMAFVENAEHKPQVNHIDGNKTNNSFDNLEWCTNGENQIHAYKIGLNYVTGRAGRPKRRVCMIDPTTKEIVSTFESINDAERKTGIRSQNIQKVLKGVRKTAGGYEWG